MLFQHVPDRSVHGLLDTMCMCISRKVPVIDTVLYLVLGLALVLFLNRLGVVCGIRHMRLDWENEVEVIKQGTAVPLYMLPNMFVVIGMVVAVVFLGMRINHRLTTIVWILAVTMLAVLSYLRVMALAREK